MAEQNRTENGSAGRRAGLRSVGVLVLAVGGVGLSMLLWGRLRLITNVPRTAYAQPEAGEVQPAADAQPVAQPVAEPVAAPSPEAEDRSTPAAQRGS